MVFYFIFKENFLLILEWDFVWRNLCYGFYIRLKTGYKCNAFSQLQVQGLKRELSCAQKSRKAASASLRMALQKAAQLRLMERRRTKVHHMQCVFLCRLTKLFGACLLMVNLLPKQR